MSFKDCPNCNTTWSDRDHFLSDPTVPLVGYQVNYGELTAGIFLFLHDTDDCGTTMAIDAEAFLDLHDGPIFEERLEDSETCPGYCQHSGNLDPCREKCECAFVRDVLQKVKEWSKTPAA